MSNSERKVSSEIFISKHGPIRVTGVFKITGIDGKEIKSEDPCEIFLCSCGRSSKKPFCDGTHNKTIIK